MKHAVLFLHGWGFDASFWEPLVGVLEAPEVVVWDRGYFGEERMEGVPGRPYLAVGHSAGVMGLLGRDLPGCVGVVSVNGFGRFVQGEDFPEGMPARVLMRMRARLEGAPERVVREFRAMCGAEGALPGVPDVARLAAGLGVLLEEDWRGRACVGWLAGADDPLGPARRVECVSGGHLLPVERPDVCAAFLRRVSAAL